MPYIIPQHGGEDVSAKLADNGDRAAYTFRLVGYASDFHAMAAIDAYKGPTVLVRGKVLVADSIDLAHVETNIYEATVNYIHPDKQKEEEPEDDAPTLSLDVTGQTVRQTHGFSVRNAYPDGADPDTFGGAINVEKDSKGRLKINGVEVEVPLMQINVDGRIPTPGDPFELGRQLARRAQKTNSTVWYGFQPGELLFQGAQVTGKRREKWNMRYKMAHSENIVKDVPNIGLCQKRGFDYFWVYSVPVVKETPQGEMFVPQAVYAFSHQMYEEFEFRELGMGG